MLDSAAHDTKVSQQTRFTLNGDPYMATVFTYWLDEQGPFTFECADAEGAEANFEQSVAARAARLRAAGLLDAASY